jgi:hypothetical protein
VKARPALSGMIAKINSVEPRALDVAGLTAKEAAFIADMTARRISFGTGPQRVWANTIGRKVFGAEQWEAFLNGRS